MYYLFIIYLLFIYYLLHRAKRKMRQNHNYELYIL
jgi:hypothetical protein